MPFTIEQLLDENLKNEQGESRKEVSKRIMLAISEIANENKGKRIAIVSHGAAIKFYLMNFCELDNANNIIFNNNIIKTNSPGIIEIIMNDKIEIRQII